MTFIARQKKFFRTVWNFNLSPDAAASRINLSSHTLEKWYRNDAFRERARKFALCIRARNRLQLELVHAGAIAQLEDLLKHPAKLKHSFQGKFVTDNAYREQKSGATKSARRKTANARQSPASGPPLPTDENGKRLFELLIRNEPGDYREDLDEPDPSAG